MENNVQKVMELIDMLAPDEEKIIYKKMNDEKTISCLTSLGKSRLLQYRKQATQII